MRHKWDQVHKEPVPREAAAGKGRTLLLLGAALLLAFLLSFAVGRYGVPPGEVVKILLSGILPVERTWTDAMQAAVLNVRLPRILMACLVGACLSAAGASYQGVFQNPMASPDILGASGGAAFGAALAILLGMPGKAITLFAFAFSLAAVLLAVFLSGIAPGKRVMSLILGGIMIGSLFSAGVSYIKLVADPSNQLPQITYWLMGSLSGVKGKDVRAALLPMALGLIPLLLLRWRVNLLALGDDEARTLGVNAGLLRLAVILCATLVTAAGVSVSGMIGWVGLVIPHLCRRLVGGDFRALMPASMLAGAAFLLLADNVSRNLLAVEIPIGILMAFLGAPFFVYLLLRGERAA